MEALSAIETQIIRTLLVTKYGPRSGFLDQLAATRVAERRLTGVGIFVDLAVPAGFPPLDQVNAEISDDHRTVLEPPGDIVGFTLFIRDGYLSMLEGYTFGEVSWPDDPVENWLVLDPPEGQPAALVQKDAR